MVPDIISKKRFENKKYSEGGGISGDSYSVDDINTNGERV